MMQDISNRTLAMLLVVAILVSLGSSFYAINKIGRMPFGGPPISGLAVLTDENATISLTVASLTAVNFTTYTIAWGSGAVDAGNDACWIDSKGLTGTSQTQYDNVFGTSSGICSTDGFDSQTGGLILENIGNSNVSLNVSCGKTAASFLGGTEPFYVYNVSEGSDSSEVCSRDDDLNWFYTNNSMEMIGRYLNCTAINATYGGVSVCNATQGGFSYEDHMDQLRFDFAVRIPSDANPGAASDTFTAIIETI